MPRPGRKSTAEEVCSGTDLSGQNILVTGANTGLGKETARVLALRGGRVIMACRDMKKALAAREDIIGSSAGRIAEQQLDLLQLDLNSLESTRSAAEEFVSRDLPLHVLINNAGIMIPDERRTADNFEAQFGINHLAHFLFTRLLLGPLERAQGARVVVVSSAAMAWASLKPSLEDINWEKRKFRGMRAYGDSKLMNMMFARELNRRCAAQDIVCNALHPGVIATELGRDQTTAFAMLARLFSPLMKNVEQGAATQVFVATDESCGKVGGQYYVNCRRRSRPDNRLALDDDVCERLWELSESLTGLA